MLASLLAWLASQLASSARFHRISLEFYDFLRLYLEIAAIQVLECILLFLGFPDFHFFIILFNMILQRNLGPSRSWEVLGGPRKP